MKLEVLRSVGPNARVSRLYVPPTAPHKFEARRFVKTA